MIKIRELITSVLLINGVLAGDTAIARDRAEAAAGKTLWPCGPSLLPCRTHGEGVINTLPYWRASASTRPIRAAYTPAFPCTNR